MKRISITVLAVVLLFATACRGERPDAAPDTPAADHAARIARGSYLVNGVARCFWCHAPQDRNDPSMPRPEMLGAGDVLDEATPVVAPNLTPDRETGLGAWSDAQIIRAVRQGVGRDGKHLRGDHPATYYSILSDDDAVAVVAYLRSLRPIRNVLPRSAPPSKFGDSVQPAVEPLRSTPRPQEATGAYLVQVGECMGCHTPPTATDAPRRDLLFGGGRRFVETRKGYGYERSPDPTFEHAADPLLQPGEKIVASAA